MMMIIIYINGVVTGHYPIHLKRFEGKKILNTTMRGFGEMLRATPHLSSHDSSLVE